MIATAVDTFGEAIQCAASPSYFLNRYARVYDATSRDWLPFHLWPAQEDALAAIHNRDRVVALKARQLGFTWLAVGYALWTLLAEAGSTVMLFSRRDDEARDLLGFRLKGMAERLPPWLRAGKPVKDDAHLWHLSLGSRAMAFPTTGGRSHTASLVIVDEADWLPDLDALLSAVKPTVDAGGKLLLLSTCNKDDPDSSFKRTYRAAREGRNGYTPIFHGWRARPGRDESWYEAVRADIWERTASVDGLHQEYPETDDEALNVGTGSREFPREWFHDGIWFDDWPGGIRLRAVGWDPSKSRTCKTGDYSALVCAGLDNAGTLWVDADLARRNAPGNVDAAYAVCEQFRPDGIAVETNQFLELFADMLAQKAQQCGKTLPLYALQNRVAKDVRIRRLAPWLAQGRLRFKAHSPGAALLVEQLQQFPEGQFDDGADALEMALRVIDYLLEGEGEGIEAYQG